MLVLTTSSRPSWALSTRRVATTMNNTAGLLKTMGKLEDAEVVYRTVSGHTCVRQAGC